MVMGCVGLLAAQSLSGSRTRTRLKYALSGMVGGIMLFALLGLSPESDVLAHLGGFVSGFALGGLLKMKSRLAQNTTANVFAGIIFCVLVILPWWLALRWQPAK
jgi:rhomboid protease GluP